MYIKNIVFKIKDGFDNIKHNILYYTSEYKHNK